MGDPTRRADRRSVRLLRAFRDKRRASEDAMAQQVADHVDRPVVIPARDASLDGDLTIPAGANGIVLFAHGSGSSRASPRNDWVAARLVQAGLATLLFDLLTRDEE